MSMFFLSGVSGLGFAYTPPDSVFLIPLGGLYLTGTMGVAFGMFTYTAESFPTKIRNTAVGIIQGFGRFSAIVFQLPALWVAENYGFSGFYILIGLLLLLPIPLLILSDEDTTGKSLEDLDATS